MQSDPIRRLNVALSGRYAIERELGAGGMATVYLANDLRHGRPVAIKVLRPELSSLVGRDRFFREVGIAARLNHPRIVALYDSGEADGVLFYVMPWIRGESLRRKLEREHRLAVEDAIRIALDIAQALDYAHALDLVHRDIKPENILFFEGVAMLADFGVALALSDVRPERLTGTGLVVGTPGYMSPEQLVGERDLDARSDVYSLACVLYEMLAGALPWTGAAAAVVTRRLVDAAPAVRRLRPTVPPHVERALRPRTRPDGRGPVRLGRRLRRSARQSGRNGPAGAAAGRRAAVPQPELGSRERVLRGRDHGRRDHAPLADPGRSTSSPALP